MMKLGMKISGSSRTTDGARTCAQPRSVVTTARKQGWDLPHTLAASPPTKLSAGQKEGLASPYHSHRSPTATRSKRSTTSSFSMRTQP